MLMQCNGNTAFVSLKGLELVHKLMEMLANRNAIVSIKRKLR